MQALFRIVNDDHPPLPEGVSPVSREGRICQQYSAKPPPTNPSLLLGMSRLSGAMFPEGSQPSRLGAKAAEASMGNQLEAVRFCRAIQHHKLRRCSEECPEMERSPEIAQCGLLQEAAQAVHKPQPAANWRGTVLNSEQRPPRSRKAATEHRGVYVPGICW